MCGRLMDPDNVPKSVLSSQTQPAGLAEECVGDKMVTNLRQAKAVQHETGHCRVDRQALVMVSIHPSLTTYRRGP